MIIFLELYFKHVQPVKFYPSGDNFTQALLVMLVTNIMSARLPCACLMSLTAKLCR